MGGRGDPPRVNVVSKVFFGNHFSQFVVIFLFQGLRNSSPITDLSPRTVNVSAQFALTNQPTMTLILVSLHYVRRIQTFSPHPLREVNTLQLTHNTPLLQGERGERGEGEEGEREEEK